MITRNTSIPSNKWVNLYLPVITDILVITGIFLILSGIFLSLLSFPMISKDQEKILSKAGNIIKSKHPNWSNEICNAVAEHKIFAGMSEEQVAESWGWPYMTNTVHTGKAVERKEWIMSNRPKSEKLYFYNGYLERSLD